MDWKDNLKLVAERMHREGRKSTQLPDRGTVTFCSKRCGHCHHHGVFVGDELECGNFYTCAEAVYCPRCGAIHVKCTGVNFSPYGGDRFLPLMKKKLISLLKTRSSGECYDQAY